MAAIIQPSATVWPAFAESPKRVIETVVPATILVEPVQLSFRRLA
jgi:hypothetical protein